jgi:hypothetical protein
MPKKKEEEANEKFFPTLKIGWGFLKFCILILIILFLFLYFNSFFGIFGKKICGDGTFYGECSVNPSYSCSDGILIQDASACGCYNGSIQKENSTFNNLPVYKTQSTPDENTCLNNCKNDGYCSSYSFQ